MIAPCAYRPVAMSVVATPTLHGGPSGSPVLSYCQCTMLAEVAGDAHMHEACLGLDDHVIARCLGVGARLSVTRHTGIDESWVDAVTVVPAEAHRCELAGDVILDEDVRVRDELLHDAQALGLFKVDGDGPLVAVHSEEVRRFGRLMRCWGLLSQRG
jgi:hypothetical protein